MLVEVVSLAHLVVTTGFIVYSYVSYRKFRAKLNTFFKQHTIIDYEEMLDYLNIADNVAEKRQRLALLAASGQLQKRCGTTFKEKNITEQLINDISQTEIDELYLRYVTCLGDLMAHILGKIIISLYVALSSSILPIENKELLIANLSADPFLEQAFRVSLEKMKTLLGFQG